MIKIITDTSTLYSPAQAKELGIDITPLSVSINHQTYREFEEIDTDRFLHLIETGAIPSSSQPSIGEKIELYEKYGDEEIIDLTMTDGLSGTYQSACGARMSCGNKERIHIINTQTLCGPHRYLLEKAIHLTKQSNQVNEILSSLQTSIEHSYSYLLPQDFNFLKRGGRLTPLAATIGGLLKIVPIMTLTEGPIKKLEKLGVKRTLKGAFQLVVDDMKEKGVNEQYLITIAHAKCIEKANQAKEIIEAAFPNSEIWMLELSPAFITQGGPGCITIQTILK